jgi:hypothetical protein
MALDLEALGLTSEDLIERVIDRLVENVYSYNDSFNDMVKQTVREKVADKVDAAVTKALSEALTAALDETVTPVDIWGNRTSSDTTIRQALAARAQSFWFEKIDKDGRPSSYGGKPRYEWLIDKKLHEEFTAAVAENAEAIVAEFRKAMKADLLFRVEQQIAKVMPPQQKR